MKITMITFNFSKKLIKFFYIVCFVFMIHEDSFAAEQQKENIESYTANWVDIVKLGNGQYRVLIKYSNIRIGEYRDAHVDFKSKKEAIQIFQKLALGAEFYWGSTKNITFKQENDKLNRY